jgi:uncharacterized protein (DUF1800 family)
MQPENAPSPLSPPTRGIRSRAAGVVVLLSAVGLAAAALPPRPPAGRALRPLLVHRPASDATRSTSARPAVARTLDVPPADTAFALHLLERATFGARPRDLQEVLRMGPQAWLDRQLRPERIDDSALDSRLAAFPAASMSVAELYGAYPQPTREQRLQRARADSARMLARSGGRDAVDGMPPESAMPGMRPGDPAQPGQDEAMPPRARRRTVGSNPAQSADAAGAQADRRGGRVQGPQRILFDLAGAKLQRAVYSERQLQEVMTDFWFNHFNVFWGKNADRYLVADYERSAIRPHVFGRFEDLLLATAHHPAMLVYLDNAQSMLPDSSSPQAGRIRQIVARWKSMSDSERDSAVRSGRVTPQQARMLGAAAADSTLAARRGTRGINENYARELMELHTLGVDGGYTQHDVVEVARAFTGWTVQRPRRRDEGQVEADPTFVFRPAMHDRGEKVVLGHRLPAGRGEEDGLEVLHILATSPATAHHVARQLAERFVSDDPPPALVVRLAQVFLHTGGDLREVTRALFLSPEFADPRCRRAKVKTPIEFVASALRATDADVGPSRAVLQALRGFGQVPYLSSPPTGYPNRDEAWTNSGAMLSRMNFALALAAGRVDGVRLNEAAFFPRGMPGAMDDTALRAIVRSVMPGRLDEQLVRTIHDDLAGQPGADPRGTGARALGLALASPDFQRR